MSAIAAAASAAAGPRLQTETLRSALLWMMAFSGGFVFIEPGPYEVMGLATMFMFAVTGLTARPALAPLILFLVLLNVGYSLSLFQVDDQWPPVMWALVSVFLALTAMFFAAMLGVNTETRLRTLMRGYVAAAVVVSILAVGGYFHLFGGLSDMFVIFSRAKGTFKDPNVLAGFLVLPGLLMLQRMLAGRRSQVLAGIVFLLPMLAALFLSFSRAAWGQFVFAAAILMVLTFMTSRSASQRLRIMAVGMAGVVACAVLIVALLSVEQVARLFHERFALTQSYDTGPVGRFGRYGMAIEFMLEYPFGMGPLQFQFPEAPHNVYLNSFITGGWISGCAYLTLTLVTHSAAFRFAFVATPWQPTYQAVYAAFIGVAVESVIIDSDHWRHYFLILGVLWGLMAVSRPYLRTVGGTDHVSLVPAKAAT
jgi:hypothetical protein